jgi:hypothetical protein
MLLIGSSQIPHFRFGSFAVVVRGAGERVRRNTERVRH